MTNVPLPRWETDLGPQERVESLIGQIDAWIRSAELATVTHIWGASPPEESDTASLLRWYDAFSAEHWDFRRGRERNLATEPSLSASEERAILQSANALGLVGARRPERTSYDFALILGGLVRACITRPRYAHELVSSSLKIGKIVALGGFRPLKGDELPLAAQLGVTVANEFDAMVAGIASAFGISAPPRLETSVLDSPKNSDWAVAHFREPDIEVVAAPSLTPQDRRANTADTFAWLAKNRKTIVGSHVLLITNPIYVPYQGAAAIERLGMPYGVSTETVGISEAAAGLDELTQKFKPGNYLQEFRSAVRGYKSLHDAALQLAS